MEYLRQLAMINVNPNRMPVSDAMLQRIREVLLNPGEPAVDQDRLLTDVTQAVIDLEARLADAVELDVLQDELPVDHQGEQLAEGEEEVALAGEPAGVAARDRRECLLLQLDAMEDEPGEISILSQR